jgi:hypothetical protein
MLLSSLVAYNQFSQSWAKHSAIYVKQLDSEDGFIIEQCTHPNLISNGMPELGCNLFSCFSMKGCLLFRHCINLLTILYLLVFVLFFSYFSLLFRFPVDTLNFSVYYNMESYNIHGAVGTGGGKQ